MPYLAFASNFTWVMVIGLLGPSIPAIIEDLGISYTQAGLFFTMLSLGSLFGTSLGGIASDYLNRKTLFTVVALSLAIGLVSMGIPASYTAILLIILAYSFFGSPAGTVGQSIMLAMFPDRRERYISLQTSFAALGSFTAPRMILSLASLIVFLTVPWIPVKLLAIVLYGLGTAPVFPLLMARGTALFPDQPGTVSGVLFGSVSLGGMVFPLLLGVVASSFSIRLAYILVGIIILGQLLTLIGTGVWWDRR